MKNLLIILILLLTLQGCSSEESLVLSEDMQNRDIIQISDIYMVDKRNGWSHYENKLLTTDDGGYTWKSASPSLKFLNADEFFILNDRVAWIYQFENGQVKIAFSADKGEKWIHSLVSIDGTKPRIFFVNEHEGWLMTSVGSSMFTEEVILYHSVDSGTTWTEIKSNLHQFVEGLKDQVYFKNEREGWISTTLFNQTKPWLLYTNDGGENWAQQYISTEGSYQSENIHVSTPMFFDQNTGILHVQSMCDSEPCALFYLTTDGGKEWEYRSSIVHGNPERLLMVDVVGSSIWAAQPKALYFSKDMGKTWNEIETRLIGNEEQIEQIDFVSEKIGWVIVSSKQEFRLLFTEDGGENWIEITPKFTQTKNEKAG